MKTTNQTTGDYSLLSLIRGDKLIILNPATEKIFMKKIYLDVCCLNRPFDDQTQGRVRLESEAILLILKYLELGEWRWIRSVVIDYEINKTPIVERQLRVRRLANRAHEVISLTPAVINRCAELKNWGLKLMMRYIWLVPRQDKLKSFFPPMTN